MQQNLSKLTTLSQMTIYDGTLCGHLTRVSILFEIFDQQFEYATKRA